MFNQSLSVRHLFPIVHYYNQCYNNYSCSYLCIYLLFPQKEFFSTKLLGQSKNILPFFKLLAARKMIIYPPTSNTESIHFPIIHQQWCDRNGYYSPSIYLLPYNSHSALQFGWSHNTSSCQRECE